MNDTKRVSEEDVAWAKALTDMLCSEMSKVIIGQQALQERLLIALLSGGHVLLEGLPGLAKTLSIKTLAQTVNASFSRVQFTPDLLPADIVGTEIYNPADSTFKVRSGPVFAHFVLADEINRAPAKVQSALLETMQEHQVTIGGETKRVPEPFLVMATQNPIEQEGTYPLPEAQVDRFMMKVTVDYPSREDEQKMLDAVSNRGESKTHIRAVCSTSEILRLQNITEQIFIDDSIKHYIVDLVHATRKPADFKLSLEHLIEIGASPRASIALLACARAKALLSGSHYVVPQHVKDIAKDVLRHRVTPSFEAEAQGLTSDDIVTQLLEGVPVP